MTSTSLKLMSFFMLWNLQGAMKIVLTFACLEMHCSRDDEREHTAEDICQRTVFHSAHHWRDKDIRWTYICHYQRRQHTYHHRFLLAEQIDCYAPQCEHGKCLVTPREIAPYCLEWQGKDDEKCHGKQWQRYKNSFNQTLLWNAEHIRDYEENA